MTPELTTLALNNVILRPRYFSTADQAVTWVICVLALLSNSLTIVTVQKTRHGIGQKARLYILSLSFSDLLMAPTLVVELTFSKIGYLYQPLFDLDEKLAEEIYRRERVSNLIVSYMYYCPMCASLLTLFAVAVDRCVAVGHPLLYRKWATHLRIKLLLLAIWVYGLFSGACIFIWTGLKVSKAQMLATYNPIDFLPSVINNFVFMPHMYVAVTGNAIASAIAYRHFKRIGRVGVTSNPTNLDKISQRDLQRNRRFYRMVVTTITSQILLWTPFGITYNVSEINVRNSPQYMYDYVQPFVYGTTICTSWINPLLYSAFNKDYRNAYYRVLCGMIGRAASVEPSTANTRSI